MDELVKIVCDELDKKLAEDIVVIDFEKRNPVTDYFVIASARNARHASSLVDDVMEEVSKYGYAIKSYDASKDGKWLFIDLYEVVVHIFLKEEREIYALERLWKDQKILKL